MEQWKTLNGSLLDKNVLFLTGESGGYCVLCYGSLTALDILRVKCILLNRMIIYKTFTKYVS